MILNWENLIGRHGLFESISALQIIWNVIVSF